MPRYGYDYSLARSPSTGWRSRFTTILSVSAIAAISAISGAAVSLNLLGSDSAAEGPAVVTWHPLPASAPVVQAVTPTAPQPAKTSATVAQSQAPAAAAEPKSQPAAAPAPQPTATVAAAAVAEPPAANVPDRELTFTQGYARRRAVQTAADAAAGVKSESAKTDVARSETHSQVGRTTNKKRVARAQAREEPSWFGRYDRPERFDFSRHQALAYGDSRDPRANRRPPPQQGGFFGGLF